VQPEIEIMGYLTEKAPTVAIPALYGTIHWRLGAGEPVAIGLLMALIPNQGDAWAYTREHLKRSFQDSLHAPKAEPADQGKEKVDMHHALYLEIAAQLGRRTAELHRALCRLDEPNPAFRPEPITVADLDSWRKAVESQAEAVFRDLRSWLAATPAADTGTQDLVRQFLDLAPLVRERAGRIAGGRVEAMRTRYHGDLHLGQVLIKQNDVVIIDFEGEPRRSMEERRRKHSALKDVAGIIRSFDYAAAAAGRTVAELPAVELQDFQKFCAEWREKVVRKFLEHYRATIEGCPVWPRNERAAADLLDFFILEKALYEIGYELANRPQWLPIPVKAAIDLLQPQTQKTT